MSDKDTIYRQDAIKTIKDADVFVAYHEKDPIDEAVDEAIRATKRSVIYDIEMLPSAELERHYCRECKWSRCHINLDKYGRSETDWHCLNWDGGTDEEGFCHEWEGKVNE